MPPAAHVTAKASLLLIDQGLQSCRETLQPLLSHATRGSGVASPSWIFPPGMIAVGSSGCHLFCFADLRPHQHSSSPLLSAANAEMAMPRMQADLSPEVLRPCIAKSLGSHLRTLLQEQVGLAVWTGLAAACTAADLRAAAAPLAQRAPPEVRGRGPHWPRARGCWCPSPRGGARGRSSLLLVSAGHAGLLSV